MKTCYTCKAVKNLSEFHKDKSSKDGHFYQCKPCKIEYARTTPHARKDYLHMVRTRTSKVCPWCKKEKEISQYYKNKLRPDGLTNYCKLCLNETARTRYHATGDSKNKLARDTKKLDLINKLGGSCSHCGLVPSDEWPLACFDFHHKENKSESFGSLLQLKNNAASIRAAEEIKKCIILCRNCHQRHHSNVSRGKFDGLIVSPFQNNIVASKPQ